MRDDTPEEVAAELRQLSNGDRMEPPTPDEVRTYILAWQQRRLRWFGAAVPPELADLLPARTAAQGSAPGTASQAPSEDDLDETSFGTGAFSSAGPTSPLAASDIEALSPGDLIAYFGAVLEKAWGL